MRLSVTVAALPAPIRHGDFKDPAAKWGVYGPAAEFQIFARRKDAENYATDRRRSPTQRDAMRLYGVRR